MEKSVQNLKEAFAGESQANRKYLAFAEKAEKDGYPQVARLFRAAAEAETVHAMNHLKALDNLEKKELVDIYVCAVCGHTVEGEPPDQCPVCKALKKFFKKID